MNKSKNIQLRNSVLVLFFLLPMLSIGMSLISGITPVSSREDEWYSYEIVYVALGLNTVLWIMFLVLTILRFLYDGRIWLAEYLTLVMALPALLGVLAVNLIRPSLPDWRWLIVLMSMYPVVAVMPFVNQSLSAFLHSELLAPKTKLGRALVWGLPAIGITGATLSQLLQNTENELIGFAVIGLLFHFLLVWQTSSFAQQIWRQWQNERENKDGSEKDG